MGAALQVRELTADDFGGPELEGCNEVLVETRSDVILDIHSVPRACRILEFDHGLPVARGGGSTVEKCGCVVGRTTRTRRAAIAKTVGKALPTWNGPGIVAKW